MEIIGEKKEEVTEQPREVPENFNWHIEISVFPKDGRMELRTNIADLFLAMGVWEVAKDLIKQKISSENKSRVVKPNGGLANFVRNLKN